MTHAEDTYKQDGQVISILEAVWGGNYALFEAQRARLRDVWQRNIARYAATHLKYRTSQ